jgi:hypothetical protein
LQGNFAERRPAGRRRAFVSAPALVRGNLGRASGGSILQEAKPVAGERILWQGNPKPHSNWTPSMKRDDDLIGNFLFEALDGPLFGLFDDEDEKG